MHACISVQRNATRSVADQDVGAGRVGYGVQAVDLAFDSRERMCEASSCGGGREQSVDLA